MSLNFNRRFAADLEGPNASETPRPLGVAVSGGGDSLALLYALHAWNKRPLEVFCVDHGLNPLSPAWTQSVADHAARLGAGFTALHWRGAKPETGLSAAARRARHGLLADAARQKGVRTLCLAHTRDDLAEAVVMQAEGSNVGHPRQWAASPVWPQGRGIFLYRPCLDMRREDLRQFLREQNVSWIDDPANDSVKSLRARARLALKNQALPDLPPPALRLSLTQLRALMTSPDLTALGMITFKADIFHALPYEAALTCLSAAMVSAGGGDRLPRRQKLEALYAQLGNAKPASLAGARVQQGDGLIRIVREAGEFRRQAAPYLSLNAGEMGVWDGRFEIRAGTVCEIIASAEGRSGLSDDEQTALLALPASVRPGLPVALAIDEKGKQNKGLAIRLVGNAPLRQSGYIPFETTCLVLARFLQATALISCERDQDRLGELSCSETL